MKQILTTILLLFSLIISAQTTVVTGPKKKPQTITVDNKKQQVEQQRKAAQAAEGKRQEQLRKQQAQRAEQARQEQLRKEQTQSEEQARQEQLRREQAQREEQARIDQLRREREEQAQRDKLATQEIQRKESEMRAIQSSRIPQEIRSETFKIKGVSFKMCYVEGGTFLMGATSEQDSDAGNYGKSIHVVTLSDYYIGQTEVTQALWKAVMGSKPSNFKGNNLPVEKISWEDCQTFIEKLNAKTGRRFCLPTEAEWEFAARGGNNSQDYKYSGSGILDFVAWNTSNAKHKTHDVATMRANELGIYDMSGNVSEWCSDWYGSYASSAQTNPKGPMSGSFRVIRGGSWDRAWSNCRVSDRQYVTPDSRLFNVGLRLVLRP